MADSLGEAPLEASTPEPDPVAEEAAAWDRYMVMCARWRASLEPATERTAEMGMLLNKLGADVDAEPDLGWHYAELVRGFVGFSDQLAHLAEAFELAMRTAERDWRRVLDLLAEPTRGQTEARRLAEREHLFREIGDDEDDE